MQTLRYRVGTIGPTLRTDYEKVLTFPTVTTFWTLDSWDNKLSQQLSQRAKQTGWDMVGTLGTIVPTFEHTTTFCLGQLSQVK